MTVSIARPAINLLGELATLRRKVQGIEGDFAQVHFANLVENGGFDAGLTGYTVDAAGGVVTVESGSLSLTGVGDFVYASAACQTVGGAYFSLGLDGPVSGNIHVAVGGSVNAQDTLYVAATGAQTYTFRARLEKTYVTLREFAGTGPTLVDNLSLWEADPSDDAPFLRLPYGHKVGKAGQVIRDGLVLMDGDFVEISDSGQHFIKPLVAPGAHTRFTVRCRP